MTNNDTADVRERAGWRIAMWGVAAGLLLVPLVAMRFTTEVNWDAADFAFAATMLLVACGTVELGTRASGSLAYRMGVAIAVAAAFLLVWINAAVGIIGSEDNPANLMYAAVIAVGVAGASIARFRAAGMARAMIAAAMVQMAVAVIAQVTGLGFTFVITGFFVALWLTAARLFGKAAEPR